MDFILALGTAETKFDMPPFTQDGEVANRQIQAIQTRIARVRAEVNEIMSENLSHSAVQWLHEARVIRRKLNATLELLEEGNGSWTLARTGCA
jgi:hypothetical protein